MEKCYNNKLLYKLILAFFVFICIIFFRITVHAEQKEVTNSISGKKDIEELVQIFTTPCGYNLTELMKKGRSKNFDFSKTSDRRKILNLCYEEIYDKAINEYTLSMRMFDKNTSNIDLLIGDWGSSGPQIKIIKIYKISSNKYKVLSKINWYDSANISSKKIGTMRLYLTKNADSYYGYIVKSMKLKKTANI